MLRPTWAKGRRWDSVLRVGIGQKWAKPELCWLPGGCGTAPPPCLLFCFPVVGTLSFLHHRKTTWKSTGLWGTQPTRREFPLPASGNPQLPAGTAPQQNKTAFRAPLGSKAEHTDSYHCFIYIYTHIYISCVYLHAQLPAQAVQSQKDLEPS